MIYIYNKIKDMSTELNTDVNLLLKLFINNFSNNDIYMNVKKLINEFIYSEEYQEIINEFNELDHDLKESLSQFINFDKKYDRSVYLEICNLISCQIDKVTKSFEILSENDLETMLNEIIKNMNENFEKIPPDTKYKFLCYKKVEINIFKYEALKKHVGSYIELPKKLQQQGLINIKNADNYSFIWSYIRYLNPQNKNPNKITSKDKNYLMK